MAGLRERKKQETRSRLGDVAARLFAEHGYDEVSMSDVALAAGVAEQTVYNYFPTKPDLVLDRAEEELRRVTEAVADRPVGASPVEAMRAIVRTDVDRYVDDDPALARGEFPAQCRLSSVLRRRALEFCDDLTASVAAALADTDLPPLARRSRAAALVAVRQQVTEGIGDAVLTDVDREEARRDLLARADAALDDIAIWWTGTSPAR